MKQAGRRTGAFSHGHKAPPAHWNQGLDWEALRDGYRARLRDEWARGVRNPDTIRQRWIDSLGERQIKDEMAKVAAGRPAQLELDETGEPRKVGEGPKLAPKKKTAAKTGRRRGSKHYDIDEVVRLYTEENLSPQQIADRLKGPKYGTIVLYLKERKVFDPDRHRTGGRRTRESYEAQRRKHCGVCGADLDLPGNSEERFKKLPDGTTRPSGRECVPCRKRRSANNRNGVNNGH